MGFKKIDPEAVGDNPFSLIGKDWMLITAGSMQKWNTMTASWGGLGVLWGKQVSFCFIRPSRHTFGFAEDNDYYTLAFFPENQRDALNYCGSKSGRDVDKAKETGLIPIQLGSGIGFEQARLVRVCRKIYYQDIIPGQFLDSTIESNYNGADYHRMYIGQVEEVYQGE